MAYTIPTIEPAQFSAGDRVQWKKTISQFPPADGWTLIYYLRGNGAGMQQDITAAVSGNQYSVDLSPTATEEYTPGTYYWQSYVTKSGDRKPVESGTFEVLQNVAELAQPYDFRSHNRKVLDAIKLVIEGRATTDIQRYVLQAVGRSVDKMTIADLIKLRDDYQQKVNREEKPGNRNVFAQFNR